MSLDRHERRELEGLRRAVTENQAIARNLRARGLEQEADAHTELAVRDQRRIAYLEAKDQS